MDTAGQFPDQRELLRTYQQTQYPVRRYVGLMVTKCCCALALYQVPSAIFLFLFGAIGLYYPHPLAGASMGLLLWEGALRAHRRAEQLLGPSEAMSEADAAQRAALESWLVPQRLRLAIRCSYYAVLTLVGWAAWTLAFALFAQGAR